MRCKNAAMCLLKLWFVYKICFSMYLCKCEININMHGPQLDCSYWSCAELVEKHKQENYCIGKKSWNVKSTTQRNKGRQKKTFKAFLPPAHASFFMLPTIATVNNAWLRKWHKIYWLILHFPGSLISKYGPLPSLTPALSTNSALSLAVTQSV